MEQLEDRLALSTFTVLNADDSGAGSLRQAILDANVSDPAADVIEFNIPGTGVHTIEPLTQLPIVSGGGPITIDGTTQPGFDPLGLHPIELSGINMPHNYGLILTGDAAVKGLAINRFATGINVHGGDARSGDSRIEGNYIGLDPTGTYVPEPRAFDTTWIGMEYGIVLSGTNNDIVGGSTPETRNVISGSRTGLRLSTANDNRIVGNYLGTDRTGLLPLANIYGVVVSHGLNNRIGEPGAGNIIVRSGGWGAQIDWVSSGNTIQGNSIGFGATGELLSDYGWGIGIFGEFATNNLVGGSIPAARNVVANVVEIAYGSHHNKVQGNYIGLNPAGTQRVAGNISVHSGSHDNVIGTDGDGFDDATEGNVSTGGIGIWGGYQNQLATMNNVVAGNLIGTDATGMIGLVSDPPWPTNSGVWGVGVSGGASHNRIGTNGDGTSDEAERNVISGGFEIGVGVLDEYNVVAGNYIGTNKTGTAALPNRIGVSLGGSNNRLGTNGDSVNVEAERNVVSGNLAVGVEVGGTNLVAGNYVGTDATGMLPLGNGIGITTGGATIGGTTAALRNVISGNIGAGIDVSDSGGVIQGNYIGVDKTGGDPLGNGLDGVWIRWGAFSNTIGGAAAGAANIIANNGRNGVTVSETLAQFTPIVTATGNSIRGNSIYGNAALGIDLGQIVWDGGGLPDDGLRNSYVFGPTPNDLLDADAGNNQLQNFPELTEVYSSASTRVHGSLHSTTDSTFVLDFYANSPADPSGYGEGERWLGTTTVTTDAIGNATFVVVVPGASSAGEFVTATATDSAGNTSEFSAAIKMVIHTVEIDVTQGPSSVNLAINGQISVAVFSTVDFDALQVNVGSVLFAGAHATNSLVRDVNGDGRVDLVLTFRTQDTNLRSLYEQLLADDINGDGVLDSNHQTARVSLTGETVDHLLIEGFDDLDLYLSGKKLRNLLDELAASGAI